jgi:hypothetical protein
VAEWLEFLLCIQAIPGSNVNPDTGYPDPRIFVVFSVPPGKCQDSTLN